MFVDVYYTVASFLEFLGVRDFLLVLFPQPEQLASLDSSQFFYTLLVLVAVVLFTYVIVSLAIRFVSYILGVILSA